ncbi:SDR family NAD(P)-dependent oxidoreductase [Leucobacter soli]|uniref:3-oxoacyl-[acyl-carrier-protein] reductase FabG n=1 Tax=Leucobacter soli TaxID=2812850 RepID=A0A916JWH2_9MICO|nr:SDR family NAD(P)-dependent oxidoreductase [Leucobacter soli]CAG7610853.1 3-oxoacyl-[acyl-carrier-protein] reductase FabG [Leucobacter soli]
MRIERLFPRRVIVTGAMSGIGRATAQMVLDTGGRVLGVDLDDSAWSAPGFTARTADITDPASVAHVFDDAAEILGGAPDAVIHCAGIYRFKSLLDLPLDEWERIMRVNGTGSFVVAQAAARAMEAGAIVLLTSIAYASGDEEEPGAAYAASKGAVVSLTRQLAVELGARGIRVNAVAPGVIDTPMTTITQNEASTAAMLAALPARRLGTADDVAAACLFLAGEGAGYITGAVLPVDGGYLAS